MMKTIGSIYYSELNVLSSGFHGYLFPCSTEDEFDAQLQKIRKKHYTASHFCRSWRMIIDEVHEFQSDDGEPSGTAGFPILNQLRKYDIVQAGIIVVRYFGGTKLGKSGLADAYSSAAGSCIEKANLVNIRKLSVFKLIYDYSRENLIQSWIRIFDLEVLNSDYAERVTIEIGAESFQEEDLVSNIESAAHLSVSFEKLGHKLVRVHQ